MELLSNSFQTESHLEFCIQSLQDGLFFGLDCLSFLNNGDFSNIKTYFSDGDCIFKGQTLLSLKESDNLKKENLLSAISYLSGVYTLISCWTEKNFNFSIYSELTPRFKLSQWEEQAILKAGAFVCSFPKEFLSWVQIQNKIKQKNQAVILSESKISRDKIKNLLQATGSSGRFSLHGSFLPSDLEEFREFENIEAVYSVYLQGSFPCLPMKFAE